MEKVGERGLRLTLNERATRETPLLLAMLPILPEHATDAANFDKSSLEPLIGSGPYVVDSVRPGELVILKRNPDYWAKDLPSKRGFDNYDEIRINYFRDANTIFEAFKKGLIDVYVEADPLRWNGGYDFPAVADGRVKQSVFEKSTPSGMYGFVMNTRRPVFADRDVRAAIAGLFDFEWANQNLYANAYRRTKSYFDGSELSSHGRPCERRRTGSARTLSRRGRSRGHVRRMDAACVRRQRTRPRVPAQRARSAAEGRIPVAGRQDDRPRRQPTFLRDHAQRQVGGSVEHRVAAHARTAGHQRHDPVGRQRAVPSTTARLRLRHDAHEL
jgi:hypothetical protein